MSKLWCGMKRVRDASAVQWAGMRNTRERKKKEKLKCKESWNASGLQQTRSCTNITQQNHDENIVPCTIRPFKPSIAALHLARSGVALKIT
jgi:hypothetical protein